MKFSQEKNVSNNNPTNFEGLIMIFKGFGLWFWFKDWKFQNGLLNFLIY